MPPARTVHPDGPLDLGATLSAVTTPWGRRTDRGWVRAMRTPDGPATFRIRRDDRGIHGEAWGPGSGWALDRLEDWCGLTDDPGSFVTDHPLVGRLHARSLGIRFARTGLVFEAALSAVAAQKVTGKEAAAGLRGLTRSFSDPAPGPVDGLRLPPDPERLAVTPYHAMHPLGIERRRADIITRISREASRLDRLAGSPSDDVARFMRRIQGVGEWTVAETLSVALGDADAVSVGDFHLKHVVAWHLTGTPRGTDDEMLALLEPFRPHRGRVLRLLEAAGNYPRYGARKPLRSFAGY